MATQKKPWKDIGRYGTVGIELVLSILIGYFGGRWLDEKVGGGGWVTVACFCVGVYAGFRSIFKVSKQMQNAIERADRAEQAARGYPALEGSDEKVARSSKSGKTPPVSVALEEAPDDDARKKRPDERKPD